MLSKGAKGHKCIDGRPQVCMEANPEIRVGQEELGSKSHDSGQGAGTATASGGNSNSANAGGTAGDGAEGDGAERGHDTVIGKEEQSEASEWSVELCEPAEVAEKGGAQDVQGLCAVLTSDADLTDSDEDVDVVVCGCDIPCYVATSGDTSRFAGLEYARCNRDRQDRCRFWVLLCPYCSCACVPTRAEEDDGTVHETFRCPRCQFAFRDAKPVPAKFL